MTTRNVFSLEDLLSGGDVKVTPSLVPESTYGVVNAQQNQRTIRRAEVVIRDSAIVQSAADDLDDIQATVSESAVDGKIGLESYVAAQLVLSANPVLAAQNLSNFGPGLESYEGGDVQVGLEGLTDTIKNLAAATGKLLNRYREEMQRAFAFTTTRILIAQRGLRSLQEMASKATGSSAGATVTIKSGVLLQNGQVPSKPAAALINLADTMGYMTSRYASELEGALRQNSRAVGLIVDTSEEAYRKSFEKVVRNWHIPSVNGSKINASLLGGYQLFTQGQSTYEGTDQLLGKLAAVSAKDQMLTLGKMGPSHNVNHHYANREPREFPALSPAEVSAVAAAHLKVLGGISKLQATVQSMLSGARVYLPTMLGALGVAGVAGAASSAIFLGLYTNGAVWILRSLPLAFYPGSRSYPEQSRALARALRAQERNLRYAMFDSAQLELQYLHHVMSYCRRSLKAS